MQILKLKNAIFYSDRIVVLKKSGNKVIDIGAIEKIEYVKPTFLNYLLSSVLFGGTFPGRLEIYLKSNLFTERVHSTKLYVIKIKFKDVLKLPEVYREVFKVAYNYNK